MQQDPTADELDRCSAEEEHDLGDEDGVHEAQVLLVDAVVDQRLGQEGQDQAQQAAQQEPEEELEEEALVGEQVPHQHHQTGAVGRAVFFLLIEFGGDLEEERHTALLVDGPTVQKLLFLVGDQPVGGIGDVDLVALDLVDDDKVPLLPVDDGRQRRLIEEGLGRDLGREGPEPQ